MNNTNHRVASLLLASLMASIAFSAAPALADEFSYSFVDLSYLHTDGANGGAASGSVELARNVRLFGGVGYTGNSRVDVTTYSAGIGYIARFNDDANLTIDVGYAGAKLSASSFEVTTSDVFLGTSLRLKAGPDLEFEPSVGYVFGDTDELNYGIEGRYWVSPNMALQLGVGDATGGGDAVFTAGVRFGPTRR